MKQRASDFALLVLIGLAVVPIGLLVISSMASGWLWPHVLPPAWSGRAWIYLTDPSSEIGAALRSSFAIATAVGFVSSILALPAARAFASYSFRFRGLAMGLLALPALVPPLASTMGLHRMLLWQDLTDTAFGVGLAHIVPALPYAVLVLTNSFRRIDPQLEWQARTLGANVFEVWRSVLIPLIAPGIAAAFALAFLISWNQYLLTLLIGGGHVLTLPLEVVAFQRSGDEATSAALAVLFLLPPVLVFGFASKYLRG